MRNLVRKLRGNANTLTDEAASEIERLGINVDQYRNEAASLRQENEVLKAENQRLRKHAEAFLEDAEAVMLERDRLRETLHNLVAIFPDDPIDGEETVSEVVAAKRLLNHKEG